MATRNPRTDQNDARLRRFSEETEKALTELDTRIKRVEQKALVTIPDDETVFTVVVRTGDTDQQKISKLIGALNVLVNQFDTLRRAYIDSMEGLVKASQAQKKRES